MFYLSKKKSVLPAWIPFRSLFGEELFGDFGKLLRLENLANLPEFRTPVIKIEELEDAVTITAEIPGVKSEDIELNVQENILTLKTGQSGENKTEEDGETKTTSFSTKFAHSVYLPFEADIEKVTAELQHGVLNIRVPKPEVKVPKRIDIKVTEQN